MSTPLADCAAMAPLLAAFARGTKRSRLRQLVVVCPAGHTLIEVFPTAAGSHAVWQLPQRPTPDGGPFAESWQMEWMAAPLIAPAAAGVDAASTPRPSTDTGGGVEFVTRRGWGPERTTPSSADATEQRYLDSAAACRCTKTAHVDGRQLTEWLAAGTRRQVIAI